MSSVKWFLNASIATQPNQNEIAVSGADSPSTPIPNRTDPISNAVMVSPMPRLSKCCVCLKDCNGSHKCAKCNNICHAICGNPIEENYGAPVVCFNCIAHI